MAGLSDPIMWSIGAENMHVMLQLCLCWDGLSMEPSIQEFSDAVEQHVSVVPVGPAKPGSSDS